MIKPIVVQDNNSGVKNESLGVDFSLFTSGIDVTLDNSDKSEKKRGRPKKTKTMSDGSVMVVADDKSNNTQEPYIDSYNETTMMLKSSINQIDSLTNDVSEQFNAVKVSRTLKKKYEYLTELANTSSSLLSAKITAIREINKTITDCHNLEMKRLKELKLDISDQDDDKRIMDMYQAFISTPVGSIPGAGQLVVPSASDLTLPNDSFSRADIVLADGDPMMAPLTPEQNRMRMENNPNVKEVVVYNKDTGEKYFDVLDMTTMQSIPNYTRSADFLLDNVTINLRAGTARNADIDRNWTLIVVGQGSGNVLDY